MLKKVKNTVQKKKEETKERNEFLTKVFYFKQIAAFIIGAIFGIFHLTGIFIILCFPIVGIGLIYAYVYFFLKIEKEQYGGFWEILKDTAAQPFATFFVSWVNE